MASTQRGASRLCVCSGTGCRLTLLRPQAHPDNASSVTPSTVSSSPRKRLLAMFTPARMPAGEGDAAAPADRASSAPDMSRPHDATAAEAAHDATNGKDATGAAPADGGADAGAGAGADDVGSGGGVNPGGAGSHAGEPKAASTTTKHHPQQRRPLPTSRRPRRSKSHTPLRHPSPPHTLRLKRSTQPAKQHKSAAQAKAGRSNDDDDDDVQCEEVDPMEILFGDAGHKDDDAGSSPGASPGRRRHRRGQQHARRDRPWNNRSKRPHTHHGSWRDGGFPSPQKQEHQQHQQHQRHQQHNYQGQHVPTAAGSYGMGVPYGSHPVYIPVPVPMHVWEQTYGHQATDSRTRHGSGPTSPGSGNGDSDSVGNASSVYSVRTTTSLNLGMQRSSVPVPGTAAVPSTDGERRPAPLDAVPELTAVKEYRMPSSDLLAKAKQLASELKTHKDRTSAMRSGAAAALQSSYALLQRVLGKRGEQSQAGGSAAWSLQRCCTDGNAEVVASGVRGVASGHSQRFHCSGQHLHRMVRVAMVPADDAMAGALVQGSSAAARRARRTAFRAKLGEAIERIRLSEEPRGLRLVASHIHRASATRRNERGGGKIHHCAPSGATWEMQLVEAASKRARAASADGSAGQQAGGGNELPLALTTTATPVVYAVTLLFQLHGSGAGAPDAPTSLQAKPVKGGQDWKRPPSEADWAVETELALATVGGVMLSYSQMWPSGRGSKVDRFIHSCSSPAPAALLCASDDDAGSVSA